MENFKTNCKETNIQFDSETYINKAQKELNAIIRFINEDQFTDEMKIGALNYAFIEGMLMAEDLEYFPEKYRTKVSFYKL